MDNLRQISQSVAHEIRNPLVSIGGYTNMLIKKCQSTPPAEKNIKEYIKYLKYIESDVERLSVIVNQVETYSDIAEINLKRKNISIMINKLLMYAEKITKKHDIPANFLVDIPVEFIVYTDEKKLKGALQKLLSQSVALSNRIKPFSLNISTTPYECTMVIRICTDLPKEEISFLFNPFYSPPGKKLTFDFASAQRIVILHGGNISARWIERGVLQFKVSLPKEKRLSDS